MPEFDVSALVAHIEESAEELKQTMVMGHESANDFEDYYGLRAGQTHRIGTHEESIYETAYNCNPSTNQGTTTLGKVDLTVKPLEFYRDWCLDELQEFFIAKTLPEKTASGEAAQQSALFKQFTDRLYQRIDERLEVGTWQSVNTVSVPQGYPAVGASNWDEYNGVLRTIDAASGVINSQTVAGTSVTNITLANAVSVMTDYTMGMPILLFQAHQSGEASTYMGWDTFRIVTQAYMNANQFNFYPDKAALKKGELELPSGLIIKARMGLNSANAPAAANATMQDRIVTFKKTNIAKSAMTAAEVKTPEVWYDKDTKKLKFRATMSVGYKEFFGSEIYMYKNA